MLLYISYFHCWVQSYLHINVKWPCVYLPLHWHWMKMKRLHQSMLSFCKWGNEMKGERKWWRQEREKRFTVKKEIKVRWDILKVKHAYLAWHDVSLSRQFFISSISLVSSLFLLVLKIVKFCGSVDRSFDLFWVIFPPLSCFLSCFSVLHFWQSQEKV